MPYELWVQIGNSFALADFAAVCALGGTCHTLRSIARHPQIWQRLCEAAYCCQGYLPCESQLRLYSWSYREMFMRRARLRFDGLYYLTTTKLLHGLNEGRGMKIDSTTDYYNPGGRWVTSFRVLRFYPCGRMLSFLVSSQTPGDIRKSVSQVNPDRPQSLHQKLSPAACWGEYDLREMAKASPCTEGLSVAFDGSAAAREGGGGGGGEGGGDGSGGSGSGSGSGGSGGSSGSGGGVHLTSRVRLVHPQYPNMSPTTVRYVFELRETVGGRAPAACGPAAAGGASAGLAAAAVSSRCHTAAGSSGGGGDGGGGGSGCRRKTGASNAELLLKSHAIESADGSLESIPVTKSNFHFLCFSGPIPQMLPFRPLAPRASGQYDEY